MEKRRHRAGAREEVDEPENDVAMEPSLPRLPSQCLAWAGQKAKPTRRHNRDGERSARRRPPDKGGEVLPALHHRSHDVTGRGPSIPGEPVRTRGLRQGEGDDLGSATRARSLTTSGVLKDGSRQHAA